MSDKYIYHSVPCIIFMSLGFSDVKKLFEAVFQCWIDVYILMFPILANGFACLKQPLTWDLQEIFTQLWYNIEIYVCILWILMFLQNMVIHIYHFTHCFVKNRIQNNIIIIHYKPTWISLLHHVSSKKNSSKYVDWGVPIFNQMRLRNWSSYRRKAVSI
jgi:hypothetical protein